MANDMENALFLCFPFCRPMLDGLSALKMISWKAPSPRVI